MKKTVKHGLLLSSLIASTLAISPVALAEIQTAPAANTSTNNTDNPATTPAQNKANHDAIKSQAKVQNDLLEKVNKSVSEGFAKVMEAGKLIDQGKNKEAITALEAATGKFDIAIAANPELGLTPIDARVHVTEMITTSATVKAQVSLANSLLKDSKVQAARSILLPMRDDIETRTIYLPMATYPDAIKLATKMLVDGNKEAALETLNVAFSTLVQKISIIPLSLIRAEAMVIAASELDKEKGKEKAMNLLDAADEQLKIAVALGYTTDNSIAYEDLSKQIKALKKEAKGPNMVEKLYTKLRESFKNLVKESSEQKEEKKEEVEVKK